MNSIDEHANAVLNGHFQWVFTATVVACTDGGVVFDADPIYLLSNPKRAQLPTRFCFFVVCVVSIGVPMPMRCWFCRDAKRCR